MSKENEEKVTSTLAEKVVTDLILIAVGVLFCLNLATTVVSITIGVALCLFGAINIALAIVRKNSLFSPAGIVNAVLVAVGVAFIVLKPLGLFVQIIPYIFCAVGAVFILDACIAKFARKDVGWVMFAVEMVAGVACLALGLCLLFVDALRPKTSVIFGVGLIVFAVYRLVDMIVRKRR